MKLFKIIASWFKSFRQEKPAIIVTDKQQELLCNIQEDWSSAMPVTAPRCRVCGHWTDTPCGKIKEK